MERQVTARDQYWATLEGKEFLDEIHGKHEDFYDDLKNTGIFYAAELSYRAYYGANMAKKNKIGQIFDSTQLQLSGKQGEIVNLKVNHYRNLIQHTLQLATSQKKALTCRAANTDYKSQAQTILAKGVVDSEFSEKKVSRFHNQAIENGLVLFEGWVHAPWNATKGRVYDRHPQTQAPIYEGDTDYSVHSLLDVPRDISLKHDEEPEWLSVRNYVNRWNLVAKYPHAHDAIINAIENPQEYENYESFSLMARDGELPQSDRVLVWTFYHRPTEAMPKGRLCQFINSEVLFDGPFPYDSIPLYGFRPENLIDTPYGYSPAFDLLAPQQGLDILYSTIMTNNATNGVQNLWTKRKDNISVRTLSGGMKNLQSDEMPQALQLTKTAPETFQFTRDIVGDMETLIGISSTVRGNPEANLKSGSALALVVSQSIQFASIIEEGANGLTEDIGTGMVKNLQRFAKTPRIANIMGESNRPYQKEFSGKDIDQVNRVVVEQVNPLSKTVAGRVEIANNLLEKGLIETPQQYIMVLSTGQLEGAIEGVQHQLLNIRAENEDMRNSKPATAIVTDHHADHIKEHRDLLANPDARRNPGFVKLVLDHIQQHLNLWRSADPAVLMITGQQPPPPPPGQPMSARPMPPGGNGGGPSAPGMTSAPPGPAPGNIVTPNNPIIDGKMPSEPNMPKLPDGAPPEAQGAYDKLNNDAA